jgi:CHASE3 domain sensor protein
MKKSFLILSLFSLLLSLGITFGYTSEDLSNANYLGDQKIITKQTVASKYTLDSKMLRQEVIGMALKIK